MPRRFSSFGRPFARILAASGMVAAVSVGFGAPASAHDVVVKSTPEANSTVDHLPEKIVLNFSGEPQEGFNTIALSHDGEVLFRDEPTADGRELSVDVPADVQEKKDGGEYTVGYQITSSDGHSTRGSLKFNLASADGGEGNGSGGGSQSEGGSEEGAQGEQSLSVPSWLLPLGGIVVVVGALAIAIARFRDLKDD